MMMRDRYRPRHPCPCCTYRSWERADDKREAQEEIDVELLWIDDSMMYDLGLHHDDDDSDWLDWMEYLDNRRVA